MWHDRVCGEVVESHSGRKMLPGTKSAEIVPILGIKLGYVKPI